MLHIELFKFRIKILLRVIAVSFAALLNLSQPVYANFLNVKLLRFDSRVELENFARDRQRDSRNGLTIPWWAGNKLYRKPLYYDDEKQSVFVARPFRLGQYLIVCFTPSKDMKLMMIDINPKGQKAKFFPHRHPFVPVSKGVEYCLGDSKSELTLQMGDKSGKGYGILYLVGISIMDDLPSYNNLTISDKNLSEVRAVYEVR